MLLAKLKRARTGHTSLALLSISRFAMPVNGLRLLIDRIQNYFENYT